MREIEEAVIKAVLFVVQCDKCGCWSAEYESRRTALDCSVKCRWNIIVEIVDDKRKVTHLCPTCADAAMGFEQLKLPFEEIEIEVMV